MIVWKKLIQYKSMYSTFVLSYFVECLTLRDFEDNDNVKCIVQDVTQ